MANYYEILGVSVTATRDEVKKAYRAVMLQNHPDKTVGLGELERSRRSSYSQAANVAYETLLDEDARKKYDAKLRKRRAPSPSRPSKASKRAPFMAPKPKTAHFEDRSAKPNWDQWKSSSSTYGFGKSSFFAAGTGPPRGAPDTAPKHGSCFNGFGFTGAPWFGKPSFTSQNGQRYTGAGFVRAFGSSNPFGMPNSGARNPNYHQGSKFNVDPDAMDVDEEHLPHPPPSSAIPRKFPSSAGPGFPRVYRPSTGIGKDEHNPPHPIPSSMGPSFPRNFPGSPGPGFLRVFRPSARTGIKEDGVPRPSSAGAGFPRVFRPSSFQKKPAQKPMQDPPLGSFINNRFGPDWFVKYSDHKGWDLEVQLSKKAFPSLRRLVIEQPRYGTSWIHINMELEIAPTSRNGRACRSEMHLLQGEDMSSFDLNLKFPSTPGQTRIMKVVPKLTKILLPDSSFGYEIQFSILLDRPSPNPHKRNYSWGWNP